MIAYLNGKIILKKDKFLVIEVAGVGYKVFVSSQTLLKLPETGEPVKLYIYHNITEEASDLYGFLTYGGLEFFEILMDIRGVGPRSALDISQLGSIDKIKERVLAQDEKILTASRALEQRRRALLYWSLREK
jgi:Holliday junction DNA helicase RuvA